MLKGVRMRMDPWAVEYNTAYYAEVTEAEPDDHTVDVTVEGDWVAHRPLRADIPWQELYFLDGSRRIEARVLLEDEATQLAFGALGTYAVGAVSCCAHGQRRASYIETLPSLQPQRICAFSNGEALADFVMAAAGGRLGELRYKVISSAERDPDAALRRIQQEMLSAEGRLATKLLSGEKNALIICDGPRPLIGAEDNVVGYVKTIHEPRISRAQLHVVQALEEGERSPIYLVKTREAKNSYFEWFVRLRDPRPWLYSLAGMVRLQAHAGTNYETRLPWAQQVADYSCVHLRKYASLQYQDPRAPQQLLPTRGLERELHRRMGHPQVIRRRIMQYLASFETAELAAPSAPQEAP